MQRTESACGTREPRPQFQGTKGLGPSGGGGGGGSTNKQNSMSRSQACGSGLSKYRQLLSLRSKNPRCPSEHVKEISEYFTFARIQRQAWPVHMCACVYVFLNYRMAAHVCSCIYYRRTKVRHTHEVDRSPHVHPFSPVDS